MIQRRKIVYRIICFLPLVALLFFICLGVCYQRTFVRAAEYKPTVVGADNINAKLYLLDAGPPTTQGTGIFLLLLSEVDGRRVEGYYINLTKKKIGYANFSVSNYTPLVGPWAIMDRNVLNGFRAVEELNADFQNLSRQTSGGQAQGVMITLKGPTEMAINLDSSTEQLYKKRLICQKTILLER